MRVPKEIVCYVFKENNFVFLLVLSNLQGWGLIKLLISSSFFNNNFNYYYKEIDQVNIYNFILGFYKNYICFLKIKGMGFKGVLINKNLMLKIGYSHKTLFIKKKDLLIRYAQKYLFKIDSRCLNLLKNVVYILQEIKPANTYKKKRFVYKRDLHKFKN